MAPGAAISQQLVGRMGAALFLAGGFGTLASTLLPTPPTVQPAGVALVGIVAMAIGVVVWFLPWQRWPRRASLGLVPIALGLVAINNHVSGAEPYRYAIFYAISFVWVGFGHPRGTSIAFAPLFLVTYLAPFFTTGTANAAALSSTLFVVPVCLMVGEAMAWVSDRLRALERERLIESTEARFRSLVQNASDIILILGPDLNIQYESPAIESMLGHRVADRIGRSPLDIVHPDERTLVDAALRELVDRPGAKATFEYRVRHAGGGWHTIEAQAHNLLENPNVRGIVLNYRDVSERRRMDTALQHQALHDALTGLPNRVLFSDRVEHAVARSARRPSSVAILLADLDDFRTINDSLGHPVGDRVLTRQADRLRGEVRAGDTVARLGGDEFAMLLEDVAVDEAVEAAERILRVLSTPIGLDDRRLQVTASIGVVVAASSDQTAEDLLRQADAAMYLAKERGRGRVAVFEPGLQAAAERRLDLKADLAAALARGELVLYYQPLVDLRAEAIVGVEALLRWQHPTLGLLLPGEFIALAEESGVIVPIGAWVLAEACRQAATWDRERSIARGLRMSVNLSAAQLHDADLRGWVVEALGVHELSPARLTLEITESLLVSDAEATTAALTELRSLGVKIAIDDFGTGYSSLSYLRRFPVDTLKVDRSFVATLGRGKDENALVRSIIKLAQTLRLETVAEGVEKSAQASRLRAFGTNLGQGYLFGRPQSAPHVEKLLRRPVLQSA